MNRAAGIRMLIGAVSAAVVAALFAALTVLGSPAHQRQLHLDERRVRDLETIANWVGQYADGHDALPPELSVLDRRPGPRTLPADPETGLPYDYAVVAADAYRLCATFGLPTPDDAARNSAETTEWTHGAGRQCFERRKRVGKS